MRRLILLGLAIFLVAPLQAQQHTRSPHGDLKLECKTCHRSDGWKPVRIAKAFDHSKFGFALLGAHTTATCRACHENLDFKGVKSDCLTCHADRHQGELGVNCARCHTNRSFLDREVMSKAHQLTRFPLTGAHKAVDCASCHKPTAQGSLQFVGMSGDCVTCHTTDFNNAPKHKTALDLVVNFQTCSGCHLSAVSWTGAGMARGSHPATPIDPNAAGHASLTCDQCHTGQPYSRANAQQTCVGCHNAQFVATTTPSHSDAGFVASNCEQCHSQSSLAWTTANWQHPTAPFSISVSAPHAAATCAQCHTTKPYSTTPTTCYGCHQPQFALTGYPASPPHVSGGMSHTCTDCHSVTAALWNPSSFSHSSTVSIVKLTDPVHSLATCQQCHVNGQTFTSAQNTCYGCHSADYIAAKTRDASAPDHVAGNLDHNCLSCHSLTPGWLGATAYNHQTPLSLTGPHAGRQCLDCHIGGDYTSKWQSATCWTCHQANYASAATPQPSHATGQLSQTCTLCHSVGSMTFSPATLFQHPSTPMALTGQHALSLRSCADCHTGVYASVQTTCYACHQGNFQLTGWPTSPPHVTGVLDHDCTKCHNASLSWTNTTFNHSNTVSIVKLTDPVHSIPTCQQCHINGQAFAAAQNTCYGCHSTDYINANKTDPSAPDHVAAGYSQDCTQCHAMQSGWLGATFSHLQAPFALVGQHANNVRQCTDCHVGTATHTNWPPQTCVGCHGPGAPAPFLNTYGATVNPPHAANPSSFPTASCATCHSVSGPDWTGSAKSQFNHATTGWALTGPHTAFKLDCSNALCHGSNNNYLLTSKIGPPTAATFCYNCHKNDYTAAVNPAHTSANGFGTDCTTCHTAAPVDWHTPQATYATHKTTPLLMNGQHAITLRLCTDCHKSPTYATVSLTCDGCHTTDWSGAIDPNHKAAGMTAFAAANCANCHSQSLTFTTDTWVHPTGTPHGFKRKHHGANTCSDCHVNTADYTVSDCQGCHKQTSIDNSHKGRSGYVAKNTTQCATCHDGN